MKEIILTQGKTTIVDDEDYEWLSKWKWSYSGEYARRGTKVNGVNKTNYMHKEILNAPNGFQGDHINFDKLDNRRANLRICNQSQNTFNRPLRPDNKSGYKGVCWHKHKNKWHARVKINGKHIHLGYYSNLLDAAHAYLEGAKDIYGEFTLAEIERTGEVTNDQNR